MQIKDFYKKNNLITFFGIFVIPGHDFFYTTVHLVLVSILSVGLMIYFFGWDEYTFFDVKRGLRYKGDHPYKTSDTYNIIFIIGIYLVYVVTYKVCFLSFLLTRSPDFLVSPTAIIHTRENNLKYFFGDIFNIQNENFLITPTHFVLVMIVGYIFFRVSKFFYFLYFSIFHNPENERLETFYQIISFINLNIGVFTFGTAFVYYFKNESLFDYSLIKVYFFKLFTFGILEIPDFKFKFATFHFLIILFLAVIMAVTSKYFKVLLDVKYRRFRDADRNDKYAAILFFILFLIAVYFLSFLALFGYVCNNYSFLFFDEFKSGDFQSILNLYSRVDTFVSIGHLDSGNRGYYHFLQRSQTLNPFDKGSFKHRGYEFYRKALEYSKIDFVEQYMEGISSVLNRDIIITVAIYKDCNRQLKIMLIFFSLIFLTLMISIYYINRLLEKGREFIFRNHIAASLFAIFLGLQFYSVFYYYKFFYFYFYNDQFFLGYFYYIVLTLLVVYLFVYLFFFPTIIRFMIILMGSYVDGYYVRGNLKPVINIYILFSFFTAIIIAIFFIIYFIYTIRYLNISGAVIHYNYFTSNKIDLMFSDQTPSQYLVFGTQEDLLRDFGIHIKKLEKSFKMLRKSIDIDLFHALEALKKASTKYFRARRSITRNFHLFHNYLHNENYSVNNRNITRLKIIKDGKNLFMSPYLFSMFLGEGAVFSKFYRSDHHGAKWQELDILYDLVLARGVFRTFEGADNVNPKMFKLLCNEYYSPLHKLVFFKEQYHNFKVAKAIYYKILKKQMTTDQLLKSDEFLGFAKYLARLKVMVVFQKLYETPNEFVPAGFGEPEEDLSKYYGGSRGPRQFRRGILEVSDSLIRENDLNIYEQKNLNEIDSGNADDDDD